MFVEPVRVFFRLEAEDADWLASEAMRLSRERGNPVSSSSLLRDMVREARRRAEGKKS